MPLENAAEGLFRGLAATLAKMLERRRYLLPVRVGGGGPAKGIPASQNIAPLHQGVAQQLPCLAAAGRLGAERLQAVHRLVQTAAAAIGSG